MRHKFPLRLHFHSLAQPLSTHYEANGHVHPHEADTLTHLHMFVQSIEEFLVQDAVTAGGQSVDVYIVSNAVQDL